MYFYLFIGYLVIETLSRHKIFCKNHRLGIYCLQSIVHVKKESGKAVVTVE